MSSSVEKPQLSAYEQLRIDNIKRNNARLRALGLISSSEERQSNAMSCGEILKSLTDNDNDSDDGNKNSESESSDDDGEWHGDGGKRIATKRKRKNRPKEAREGSRKSRRLKGEQAELDDCDNVEGLLCSGTTLLSLEKERAERVLECREVRLRAANAIAACGGEAAAKKNPTATYEHCLMRVKTMSEKALVNRAKMIEKRAGKHSVVKMAIFKSCLQDEGMWELAEVASDALERLKALQPIPEG